MSSGTRAYHLEDVPFRLPTTRYRGSKRRYATQIAAQFVRSQAMYVADPFGGSGAVSTIADALGLRSDYNDLYHWTTSCARALLVHSYSRRDLTNIQRRVEKAISEAEVGFVSECFEGCYFTAAENLELDGLIMALQQLRSARLRDLLFYGIAQAALAKLPMSMFHRASLDQRLAGVPRRSGNGRIWATPFRILVPQYVQEAVLYTWHRRATHSVTQGSALDAVRNVERNSVLFLDPPYINPSGGVPTYSEAYHFLEGITQGPEIWEQRLDRSGNHPIYRGSPQSIFDTASGWVSGVEDLLGRVRGGGVFATARAKDEPGARELRRLLRARFGTVRAHQLHSTTIFSERSNPEYLFCAS